MDDPAVLFERSGRIAHIRLNRPDKRNTVNAALLEGLTDALYRLDAEKDLWVGILSGIGPSFCGGIDLSEGRTVVSKNRRISVLLSRFENYKPVIAAVHGAVYGAGLIFSLQCDLVVADDTARFQNTEIKRGFDGSSVRAYIEARSGGSFADDLTLTARECLAGEALARGLVHRTTATGEHVEGAENLASEMLELPPLAVRAAVRSRRTALEQLEARVWAQSQTRILAKSRDSRESIEAWQERRQPRYEAK